MAAFIFQATLWLIPTLVHGAEPAVSGRFGGALSAPAEFALVAPSPVFFSRPLTIECWARLNSKKNYNILLACESKASAAHWELYTHTGSGHLALYVPRNNVKDVRSQLDLADGQWHYLAVVMDGRTIRLYCDAKEVASAPDSRPAILQGGEGRVAVGALVEGGLACDGSIDDARISLGGRAIVEIPSAPLAADASTLGLWHFDEAPDSREFADASSAQRTATRQTTATVANRNKPGGGAASLIGVLAKDLTRPASGQVGVIPPEASAPALRRSFRSALEKVPLPTLGQADAYRDALLLDWNEYLWHLANQVTGRESLPSNAADQTLDPHALVTAADGDALGVVLRRTRALLERLQRDSMTSSRTPAGRDLDRLQEYAARIPLTDVNLRQGAALVACALNRDVALANPLLDFDRILFVARGVYQGSRKGGLHGTADFWGQHFATQYFGFNSIPGGGLFMVRDFKSNPCIVNVLDKVVVEQGRLKGKPLPPGAFLSPELSYDAKTILFAYTQNREHNYEWTPETTWKVFRVNVDGTGLRQLTDGAWDDFDPCWLPNGRIAFISERRGGYIRCFGGLKVPQHSLHSMNDDGSDLYPLSFFETGEWHPSVNNDGMIVYTRWDYVDRENCLGSNFWICHPDGRNPRAPHGNYPYPWHTFADNTRKDGRKGRPFTEMNIRAIPGSPQYILTAAPHHGEAFGGLCLLDLRLPDDGFMSQLRRITPYVKFPESEMPARQQYPYGTAWPLNKDFYLCNRWENLYLLDRFGNQVLLCENSIVFGGATDWDMRLVDPIPVRARPVPPVQPDETNQGQRARADAPPARISIQNIYASDQPFPPGTRIKYVRVLQNIPKTNPEMNLPANMGYHWENTPRVPLGVAPVLEDGSAHFLAPVERELIFQALDENFMAVQTMRSVTYAHRGEHLSCIGCHETSHQAPRGGGQLTLAQRQPPVPLQPEVGPVEPITFYRLVKPVFARACLPCHQKENKGPQDMGFEALRPYVFYFAGGMSGHLMDTNHGGSRSIPGRMGARHSRLGAALLGETHRGKVSPEDFHRVVLWLDANALRLGAFHDEEKQVAGELVWPLIDCDPQNPQGLERPLSKEAGSVRAAR